MLRAFLERNYLKVAKVHLRAGYIPAGTNLENFAQSCRAIGEPIVGLSLDEISLAKLLSQLFRLAKTYRMEIQPQLLLLQKNMLMAEGIGRHLNPDLNIWILIKPMIAGWMQENRGIEARIANSLHQGIKVLERIPELTGKFEKTLDTLANREHITQQLLITRYRRFRYVNDSLLWLSIIALASWFFLH